MTVVASLLPHRPAPHRPDLKNRLYLVGPPTPFWPAGWASRWPVTVSTVAIGATLNLMNKGMRNKSPANPGDIQSLPSGVKNRARFVHLPKQELRFDQFLSVVDESPDGENSTKRDRGTKSRFQWAKASAATKAPRRKHA